jgi:RecA-family ATPase
MRARGYKQEEVEAYIGVAALLAKPPLPEKKALDFVKSAFGYSNNEAKEMAEAITIELKSLREIVNEEFPDPKWVVEGLLSEGLNLLVGVPKIGKSLLAMNICQDLAYGNKVLSRFPVEKSRVLAFFLEDSYKRLQRRFRAMLPSNSKRRKAPKNLIIGTNLPGLDLDGLDVLEEQIEKMRPDIVVIDTLQRIRDQSATRESYKQDYLEISKIANLSKKLDIPFLVLHHTRKDTSGPNIARVLGTYGIAGAADGILELMKDKNEHYALSVAGRDIDEARWVIERDEDFKTWRIVSTDIGIKLTKKQHEVLDTVRNVYPEAISPKEVAKKTGLRRDFVNKHLSKLVDNNVIRKHGHGLYIDIIDSDEDEWEDQHENPDNEP